MPTFAEPFEMMEACHERVARMLTLLKRLREHLPQHGADVQAQQAAKDIMKYFDQAAPQHHEDEEKHVFPPLLERGDALNVATVRKLQQDHRAMETGWKQAREVLDVAERRMGDRALPDHSGHAQPRRAGNSLARERSAQRWRHSDLGGNSFRHCRRARLHEDLGQDGLRL